MKKLIVANWKMNPQTTKKAVSLFSAAEKAAGKNNDAKIVVCPPFVYLGLFSELIKNKNYKLKISLASQDVFWNGSVGGGTSYTGEISAKILKNLNVAYVIIGHSERRQLGETDEIINKKIKQALKNNLKVVFCVGESERDEVGNYLQFLREEIISGLDKIPTKLFKNIIIAYEPIWAISSNKSGKTKFRPDTPEDAFQMATYIKRILVSLFGKAVRNIPILYGGSVDKKNAKEFLEKGNVDGLLVGRTSWDEKSFADLLENIK